jgi:hypothetical protein
MLDNSCKEDLGFQLVLSLLQLQRARKIGSTFRGSKQARMGKYDEILWALVSTLFYPPPPPPPPALLQPCSNSAPIVKFQSCRAKSFFPRAGWGAAEPR